MICFTCRSAGTALQNNASPEHIAALHEACRGGTWCDCRHSLTSSLNTLLIKPVKEVSE